MSNENEMVEISINGHIRQVHEDCLRYLITHNMKQFNNIHSYTIECGEVTEKICDTIVDEITHYFPRQYFDKDEENEMFYYVFCNKYFDTNKRSMPKFKRVEFLQDNFNAFSKWIVNKKYCFGYEKMLITIINETFNKLGLDARCFTCPGNGSLGSSGQLSMSLDRKHPLLNTLLCHACNLGIDIYDEFIRYFKITDSEIFYYGLDFENAPRYEETEFTKLRK